MKRISLTAPLFAAVLCTGVLLSVPALAQIGGSNNAVSIHPKAEETLGPARVPPPPALPGARSQGGAAPATKLPTDMSPNDALFDSINRGDITAARDALSRGADLQAHNVLGMTPMELSVDLGRNDISFLLLSMRGGSAPAGHLAAQPAAAAAKPAGRKAAPAKIAVAAPGTVIRSPVLFANDGGAPVPDAGFLGFDAGRGMR